MGKKLEHILVWRSAKGILFPNRHMPFRLDGKAFIPQSLPALPSAKSSLRMVELGKKIGSPEHIVELTQEAESAQRLEQTGEYNEEDCDNALYKLRRLMDKFLLCRKKNPSALADLASNLDYGLTQLYLAAKKEGNRAAATQFGILLAKHGERLRDLSLAKPKIFEALAHQLPTFPVPGSQFKEHQIENDRLINEVLLVGKDYWKQQHSKPRQAPTAKAQRAKKIAADLVDYLGNYRIVYPVISQITNELPFWTKKLPKLKRLSSKNWSEWFELAWDVVLETTNGQPSEVDEYRALARRLRRKNADDRLVADAHSSISYALRMAFQELATGKHPRSSQKRD